MKEYDPLIAFVIRMTGWSLEYVRSVDIGILRLLAEELSIQKRIDDYNNRFPMAVLAVSLLNSGKGKKYKISELIGSPPERSGKKVREVDTTPGLRGGDICDLIKSMGIQVDPEVMKELALQQAERNKESP